MHRAYWLVAIAVVVLGFAAYPRSEEPRAAGGEQAWSAELARLRGELEDERMERRRETAKLEAQLRALSAARPAQANGAAPVEAAIIAEHAEDDVPDLLEPGNPQEHFETAFADQPTDASWASETESTIAQKLRAQLPDARVQSVECHASLCRLETVLPDKAALGQFMADAFKDPSKRIWNGESFSEEPLEGATGELTVVSYLAREGEALPHMR